MVKAANAMLGPPTWDDAPTGEVRARAAVQRSSPKQGMGVKFVAMEREDRARFAGWLKTLSS